MANYRINCEVFTIDDGNLVCPGATRMKAGNSFNIGIITPIGMCARSFAAIFPVALAMRCSDETPWERGRGYIDVTCPDGHVVYRLTRIKSNTNEDGNAKS